MWPFNKKETIINMKKEDNETESSIFIPQEKSFDWAHYQAIAHGGIQNAYQDEYDFIPTIRVLKSLYCREVWISVCVNAIARQFMNSKHVLTFDANGDGNEQIITRHPLLYFLSKVGKENPAFFTSNNIIDLVLTGNAYVWLAPDLRTKKRIPSERVDIRFANGQLTNYQITNPEGDAVMGGGTSLTLSPDEMLHFMMPNPYTPYVGMSLLMAINLPVLIDRYGREHIIGFFLRGGMTTGIIETDATNADQLTRFVKTIMRSIGGRRNTHADKVLPKGAKWSGSAQKTSEMQLIEILKENHLAFKAATGTTNTVLGIAENVNRATAMAEMEHFWKMTILPLQYIYCAAIKHSSLWYRFGLDDRYDIKFDNSNVEYLDDFSRKLEDDIKLAGIFSINERRERLGYDPMERFEDKLEIEIKPQTAVNPFMMSLPTETIETKDVTEITVDDNPVLNEMARIKSELPKLQDPTMKAEGYFQREFARWEDITLANLKNLKKARNIIAKRSDDFAEGYSNIIINEMVKIYDFNISRLKNTKAWKSKATIDEKDRNAKLDELKERGKRVLKGEAFTNAKTSFKDYSQTNMERIHEAIAEQLEEGKNFDDVAVYVRQTFGEFYEGQAKTIVRTEYASSMATASYQFGKDLATISKKLKKTWISMGDSHTRQEHLDLDGAEVVGDSEEVADMYFQLQGKNYLRYPKDEKGEPGEVINCRCDLIWDVVEWSE